MGLLGAILASTPGCAEAQILDLLYERTVMTIADGRCRLFTPDVSAALSAAQVQARGAARRAGAGVDALRSVEARARAKAAGTDCASQDLAVAAGRVRDAFAGYARMQRIDYPGEQAAWRADRTGVGAIRWRLAQDARFGPDRMIFGLAGRQAPGVLIAVAQFVDGETPYSARLLMRDSARSDGPYLDGPGASRQALPLDRRLPPRSGLRSYAAEARSTAGSDLRPKDARTGWAFRFPAQAAAELASLDPREAVAIEFLFPGDVVRRAHVEVGDFAAGRAFLSLASR
ncbi:hypothetical protein LJR225_002637 [Phenylobacterium sp. LjRoot225]|uniref:hypothetical protein n=1 Tax=Phenylobacterium sp. LjRoot225 TaxID=3342285 RepID=UPI003ED07F0C